MSQTFQHTKPITTICLQTAAGTAPLYFKHLFILFTLYIITLYVWVKILIIHKAFRKQLSETRANCKCYIVLCRRHWAGDHLLHSFESYDLVTPSGFGRECKSEMSKPHTANIEQWYQVTEKLEGNKNNYAYMPVHATTPSIVLYVPWPQKKAS